MKLIKLSAVVACAFAAQALCQQETKLLPEPLHFEVSFPQGHNVLLSMTASSAQRVLSGTQAQTILQLRGNVEVRMTTCPAKGPCVTSSMVLQADAVDYNEKSGEIAAHGDVHTVFVDLSTGPHRKQGFAPEPLQRPVLARAGSDSSK